MTRNDEQATGGGRRFPHGQLAYVDDIDASLDLVRANGGEVLKPAAPDGPLRWLATIADPAGNGVGVVGYVPR